MPVESRTQPQDPAPFEETPALAATAAAMIEAALIGTGLSQDVYWAAVRKSYNTPYNDPQRRAAAQPTVAAQAAAPVTIRLTETETELAPLPVAAMAPAAVELHAS